MVDALGNAISGVPSFLRESANHLTDFYWASFLQTRIVTAGTSGGAMIVSNHFDSPSPTISIHSRGEDSWKR